MDPRLCIAGQDAFSSVTCASVSTEIRDTQITRTRVSQASCRAPGQAGLAVRAGPFVHWLALPGSHGPGILTVKDISTGTDARDAATALYDGGVRNLLLHGGLEVAEPFLDHQLIDH